MGVPGAARRLWRDRHRVVALGLLALITLTRQVPLAWTLAGAAAFCALLTSIFPAFAVAQAGVERGGEIIPWILDWINTAAGMLS